MKIKNVDSLRNELYKNIKQLVFLNCEIETPSRIEWEDWRIRPENEGGCYIRKLDNPLLIKRFHRDEKTWKPIVDESIVMTVDENTIWILKPNLERQCYNYVGYIDVRCQTNKTVLMMEVAVAISKFASK